MAFIQFMRFSQQVYWGGLPFPPLLHHVLSELSAMARPSWVALHGMAHSFIELHKAVIHGIVLVSFCDCGFLSGGYGIVILASSVCPLVRGLCKLPDSRDQLWGKLCLALVGRAMLSKSLIQFSAKG